MNKRKSKRSRRLRRCTLEQLDTRLAFDGDALDIFGAGSFSMSIAPDGTQVGFRQSKLREVFDGKFGAGTVDQVLQRAIQTWVPHAAVDIGIIADDGTPAGTLGPWRGDERFGDIRVFGFDLHDSIWASAVSGDTRSVGNWAGDIVFNTAQPWTSVDELLSAAIHEIGHTLGLDHNVDPNSPMHSHGPFVSNDPLATDIELLQALHGPRRPDTGDSEHGNDQLEDASEIEGYEFAANQVDGFDGSQQWIQFGDLTTPEDIDYYAVKVIEGYRGPIAFAVQSSGFSVAELDVQLLGRDGTTIAGGTVRASEDWLLLESQDVAGPQPLYLRVAATGQDKASIGSYAIFVGTPEKLRDDQSAIALWAQRAFHWYQSSELTEDGFSYHLRDTFFSGLGTDDEHQNDEIITAIDLPLVVESTLRLKYTTVGSISNLTDIDTFRIQLPQAIPLNSSLVVDIQSLDYRGLVPGVRLVDQDGMDVAARLVSRGYGLTQLQLDNPDANAQYYIILDGANVSDRFRSGDFALIVEVRDVARPERNLVDVVLSTTQPSVEHTLYVAQTQLASFRLSALGDVSANESPNSAVVLRVYDEAYKLWKSISTNIGELQTLPGILLEAGTYFIQLTLVSVESELPQVEVVLDGLFPSNPVGPLVASIDDEPLFDCANGGDFCYPDGTQTGLTTVVGTNPPPPLPDPPTLPPLLPSDGGFWLNILLPTNPLAPRDVNGDALVTPIDALLVINYINRNSAETYPNNFVGYLDVNGDNFVAPLDALAVINWLNRNP